MKSYLSIDIDYFRFLEDGKRKLEVLIDKCLALNVPIVYKTEHHQLLGDMNEAKFSTLINIDHHSDLPDLCRHLHLNDGTWAGFIKDKGKKKFVWVMPFTECYRKSDWHPVYFKKLKRRVYAGRCDDKKNPFTCPGISGWNKVSRRTGFIKQSELDTVSNIGITLSPRYINEKLGHFAVNLLFEKGIIDKKTKNREDRQYFSDVMT